MFERFSRSAREAVVAAQAQARALGHREVTGEHLLLGVLQVDGTGSHVLHELGVDSARAAAQVAPLGDADTQALRAVGVDLEAVRRSAEAAFGPGALDRPQRRRPGLLRRAVGATGDHLPFTADAKKALEQSLRAALDLGSPGITTGHVLLGAVAEDTAPAALLLQRLGVSPAGVRERVREELRRSAA